VHESVHNNLFAGDEQRTWLNDSIGWVAALPFVIIPSSLFKTLHLQHHAFLNEPKRDPDYFCHARNPLIALGKCTILNFHYLIWYTRLLCKEQLALYAVLPAWITSIILAWVFDHIVHHPHTEQDSYTGTKIVILEPMPMILWEQNG